MLRTFLTNAGLQPKSPQTPNIPVMSARPPSVIIRVPSHDPASRRSMPISISDEIEEINVPMGGMEDNEMPGCSKSMNIRQEQGAGSGVVGKGDGISGQDGGDGDDIDIDDDNGDGDGSEEDSDPDAFKWPANVPHPLLIPDVVRDIFNKLGMQDVDKLRAVCRVWNEEACSVLQEKKLVALLEFDSMKYYLEKFNSTPYFPHQNFELHMENLLDPQIMRRFWTIFGSRIKSLDFRQSSLFIETLFDIINQHLPNLERLAIKSLPRKLSTRRLSHPPLPRFAAVQHHDHPIHQIGFFQQPAGPIPPPPIAPGPAARVDWTAFRFPQIKELNLCWCPQDEDATVHILKDLLLSLPCLERLLVTDIPPLNITGGAGGPQPVGVGTRTRVARLLVQVLTDPNVTLPHLSLINFPIEVGNGELVKLTGKRYQFKSLNLKLNNGSKGSTLKDFLTSVSSTLRTLEVTFPDGFFSDGGTFPAYSQMKSPEAIHHLQQVKSLTLKNFRGPLELLQYLPKLKTLTVNSANFDTIHGSVRLMGLRKDPEHQLQCLKTDSLISPRAIAALSESFALLRVIKLMGLDDVGLGVIYRNLPYISELEIIKGKITDQGLSGVPIEVCNDMAETSTFLFVDPAKFRSDLFLGSLQYLKTLKLVCDEVTDISVVFGIVDCKNLESLTLHSPSISDIGLFKIADMMSQLRHLDVHECENVSESGKFYVKEKMQHFPITLILEAHTLQKQKIAGTDINAFRQIGFPYRGRCVRPERYGPDEEYDRLPLRERMLMAMDRRRRFIALRMIHRVGRVPGDNAPDQQNMAAGAEGFAPPVLPPQANEDELRMLMEMHPMFAEDDAFMNFGDEEDGNNLNLAGDDSSDGESDEDIPTPPNELLHEDEIQFLPFNAPAGPVGGFHDVEEHEEGGIDVPEAMQQEFAILLNEGMLFPPQMEPDFDGHGAI